MSNMKTNKRPVMQWVSVRGADGRMRLQAVWTTVTAAHGTHAA